MSENPIDRRSFFRQGFRRLLDRVAETGDAVAHPTKPAAIRKVPTPPPQGAPAARPRPPGTVPSSADAGIAGPSPTTDDGTGR